MEVAPPRGERGLKSAVSGKNGGTGAGRSPSWGAWIEIQRTLVSTYSFCRRSPSWGAWIEIGILQLAGNEFIGRSPSWGAWIEIQTGNYGV